MTTSPGSLIRETAISLVQAARRVPPFRFDEHGKPKATSVSCVLRWILRGVKVKGAPGGRVHLEAQRVGGRWFTSEEALDRFIARLTPTSPETHPLTVRSPAGRRRASEQAVIQLEKMGI